MTLEFWYVFPISILFATTAMASGVAGATFISPAIKMGKKNTQVVLFISEKKEQRNENTHPRQRQ